MHAPSEIDVQDTDQCVAARGEVIASDGGQELRDRNIGANDRVEDPFQAKVGHIFEASSEGIDARDGDGAAGR
jgi:hypothetical protein